MGANQVHLVRHGEVHNPSRVLYGRLPGFRLSELGQRMASAAADELVAAGRPVSAVIASPLLRAQESAQPMIEAFGGELRTEDRIIEPSNFFEGTSARVALRAPINWGVLSNPLRPSWGEPYELIAARMLAAVEDAWNAADGGDVVMVSHQLPIWMVHRSVTGVPLHHNPRRRRCGLSSITTLERRGDRFVEVSYRDPAAVLSSDTVDVGAV